MAGTYVSLLVHLVWATAGRQPWIAPDNQGPLYRYFAGVLENKNARLLSAGGMPDHIHLYVSIPSTISLAALVNTLKSNSSRWMRETYPEQEGFAWQKGYGAFSVSRSTDQQVRRYIRNQAAHHSVRSFKEEFADLLTRHAIEYDERHVWDRIPISCDHAPARCHAA